MLLGCFGSFAVARLFLRPPLVAEYLSKLDLEAPPVNHVSNADLLADAQVLTIDYVTALRLQCRLRGLSQVFIGPVVCRQKVVVLQSRSPRMRLARYDLHRGLRLQCGSDQLENWLVRCEKVMVLPAWGQGLLNEQGFRP